MTQSPVPARKKLIEVALPLDAINVASGREKSIRHGHPSTLHLWWSRKPLATARAVIFAQMVDDPSSHPELFPTEAAQEVERQRLFRIIEQLVLWENTTNEEVLESARAEIVRSWRGTCEDFRDHPEAATLFDPQKLPAFHDPFAGGGSLPLEAQRLGLEAHASDLNPVAVLINKAMIEIPPRFAGRPPVNPVARGEQNLFTQQYKGAHGLAEDVRYYGKWMRDEAEKRIGHLYPKIAITDEMVHERPDLAPYHGQELTVIAWLWARTVKSPNPGYQDVAVPLVSTFMLSTKPGKEAYIEPVIEGHNYRFTVKVGKPKDAEVAKNGTKGGKSGTSFFCLMSQAPMTFDYLRVEAKEGRMGSRLMAIVAEGIKGRVFLSPDAMHEKLAQVANPHDVPETELPAKALGFRVQEYGMTKWRDLFTSRQLMALTTFSDLVTEAMAQVQLAAVAAGLPDDGIPLRDGGTGAHSYAESVGVYLAFARDKVAEGSTSICTWNSLPTKLHVVGMFGRQAISMTWDYAEANVFADSSGNILRMCELTANVVERACSSSITSGMAYQKDAMQLVLPHPVVISTDPPYYDNIGYADLSDFFYLWMRISMRSSFPELFSTLAAPKAQELVATPFRHGSKENAEDFFLDGMTAAMHQLAKQAHPIFPVTIYYAFKQSETSGEGGTSNTGWETFLGAVIRAGFALTGTWPMRTERQGRIRDNDSNALASSILLVCRQRSEQAPVTDRRAFVAALKAELPAALAHLQAGNIAPVDLAQASIGPGMAVFTRYSKVLDAAGKPLTVRDALIEINRVLDEALAEQEGDFAPDTRWAMKWFEQYGFDEGPFGEAETLATARNTSISGLVQAGILKTGQGKVRLLRPAELPATWDPETDERLSAWEGLHHLIRVLEKDGQTGAATLAKKLGDKAEGARELAYRLYVMCERKKRTEEAGSYNALVVSWPEILRLTHAEGRAPARQADLFTDDETD